MPKLRDIAKACKSKNAGPYFLTLDIMFDDVQMYEAVKRTAVINRELFAELYKVPLDEVLFTEYPPGLAWKATLPRQVVSGALGDTDVYGAQQHAPLLDVDIPL